MADEIKQKIIEILEKTFRVIDRCYLTNKEPKKNEKNPISPSATIVGSRIVFPRKRGKEELRISEQELRFVFIEQFNQYCRETGWNAFYSVETPTQWKYKFSEGKKPHKIADKEEGGQSAMVDVSIHNNAGRRICLIEFKAGNPEGFCFDKDFVKLSEEGELGFFIHLLETERIDTLGSVLSKVQPNRGTANFICHTIASKYKGTRYISDSSQEFEDAEAPWYRLSDEEVQQAIEEHSKRRIN